MPLTKIDSRNPIRGLVPTNQALRSQCQDLIAKMVFGDLSRGAGTLHEKGNLRIDMQGRTATGASNIQLQVGTGTVAAIIVESSVRHESDPRNQVGVMRALISVLNQSLDSGTIWTLGGRLS